MKQKTLRFFKGFGVGDVRANVLVSGLEEYQKLLHNGDVIAERGLLYPNRYSISLSAKGRRKVKKLEERTVTLI